MWCRRECVFISYGNRRCTHFQEATFKLADKANIELGESLAPLSKSKSSYDVNQMIDAHNLLSKFYHHLLVNTKEGQHALEYLLARGLPQNSPLKNFKLVMHLNSWDFDYKFLMNKQLPSKFIGKGWSYY